MAGQFTCRHRLLFVSYFARLSFHPVSIPIPAHHQLFDVRFLVENLATQLVVGHHPVVAVVLQGAAAHLEPCRHFLVRHKAFIAE